MKAFESFIALALEDEGFVVSGSREVPGGHRDPEEGLRRAPEARTATALWP